MIALIRNRIATAREGIAAAETGVQPIISKYQKEIEALKLLQPLELLLPVIEVAVAKSETAFPATTLPQAIQASLPAWTRQVDPAAWPHVLRALQGDILQGIAHAVTGEIASRKAAAETLVREQAARDKASA
jgi:hypothetical protein